MKVEGRHRPQGLQGEPAGACRRLERQARSGPVLLETRSKCWSSLLEPREAGKEIGTRDAMFEGLTWSAVQTMDRKEQEQNQG